ncbi:hypothetical protein EJB05_52178 [Eragrostis curvula]|uniref:Homeobox domain-containing protein n=1 Tax=Eragrostis curvula TaxID=38414 RepID=A0A5J9STT9_9POAL|nr:hypothetical protein EJB05_54583 [Eragrostis curvula]TVU01221.1 hypothetical protein EJB05_53323 [Eragrostis curvula]TVU02327.1 hypothetical protein EJB05_52178 [Eragrostis curvula]
MPQTPSTRWCPTPEQLMILEEMYRSGVRTPNAAEIQQITAHLAYYGRIEGKNVFYWFQNHKARERQRLRRRLCARHHQQQPPPIPPPPAAGSSAAAATLHPAVMHPASYAATSFIHHPHLGGYLGTLPVVQHPAAAAAAGGGNKMATAPAGGAAFYSSGNNNSSSQEDWTTMSMEPNCSASPGSSDDGFPLPPCCRRPLKTLDLFPTKSSTGGLRDECSSSKSSSCSTSTN